MTSEAHDEALAAQSIHRICKREYRLYIPPEVRAAIDAHEVAESRVRVAKEKLRWDLTQNTDVVP